MAHYRTTHDDLPIAGDGNAVEQILHDLQLTPRRICPRFFYDATGSKLFEQITRLPEYYPARTEKQLLHELAERKSPSLGDLDIIELGSGDCSKISILLQAVPEAAMASLRYIPVDVSPEAVHESTEILARRFPSLSVQGLVADFASQLHQLPRDRRRLLCFFGSTIGNLAADERIAVLHELASHMHPDDALILGVDLVKDRQTLERAYNDAQQVTAAFNRNILNVVNAIAETDFQPGQFEHVAFYDDSQQRVEMHLEAREAMRVTSRRLPEPIELQPGERIHTEDSQKFTMERIAREAGQAGLGIVSVTTDPRPWFALLELAGGR